MIILVQNIYPFKFIFFNAFPSTVKKNALTSLLNRVEYKLKSWKIHLFLVFIQEGGKNSVDGGLDGSKKRWKQR